MTDLVLAFVTGLTTGGLSCMAVQGGLLAASVAQTVERDIAERAPQFAAKGQKSKSRRVSAISDASPARPSAAAASNARISLPIILFLAAKLVAYTMLGFVLGMLGSVLQLTPMTRAMLQIGIGVFLVGNALRMLNVHPIFRYFNFEPPKRITRYLRRSAKQNGDLLTPVFLGFLTVLIPCGVTQAMMAVALGTANPLQGAAIMFAFILGTTPVFFALAYLATRLGERLEKRFAFVAADVLLVLGVVSIKGGLALTGLPVGLPTLSQAAAPSAPKATIPSAPQAAAPSAAQASAPTAVAGEAQTLTINARSNGYDPGLVVAKAGVPAKLALVTNKTQSCSRSFVIPALNIQRLLPDTGTVWVDIPAQRAGTTIKFTCSMGMYTGKITFN